MIALLLSDSIAVAQQAGPPCAGDIKTLCAGIRPGEGRIKACIKSHLNDVSEACQDRLLTVAVTGKTCKADVAKLCAGIAPGTGGVRKCIKSHIAELGESCRDAMSQAAAGKKLLGGGTSSDRVSLECAWRAGSIGGLREGRALVASANKKAAETGGLAFSLVGRSAYSAACFCGGSSAPDLWMSATW